MNNALEPVLEKVGRVLKRMALLKQHPKSPYLVVRDHLRLLVVGYAGSLRTKPLGGES